MKTELMDYYHVAWSPIIGVTRYGTVNFDDESKAAFEKGFLIVSDAILPKSDRVEISKARRIMGENYPNEYDQYVERAFEEASKVSDSLKGLKVGKLLNVPVGDGYAWYVVTNVSERSVHIEWRGFSADRWADQVLGWGGPFPRRAIEPLVMNADTLREIFERRS